MTEIPKRTPEERQARQQRRERISAQLQANLRKEKPRFADVRSLSPDEVRDHSLWLLEREGRHLAPRQLDHAEATLRSSSAVTDGTTIGRLGLISETDEYRRGWQKHVLGRGHLVTADEQRAMQEYQEVRTMAEGTPADGGFGVPILIDPTVILTSQAADAPVLDVCRVVTTTTDVWKGVTSPGVPLAYDQESAVVADDSPTFAQPVINIYKADGLLPYTLELEQDYVGFADEMRRLLSQALVDLLANKTLTGSGSNQPFGIKTRLEATSAQQTPTATHGQIVAGDLTALYGSLRERFRKRATWILHGTVAALTRTVSASSEGGPLAVDLASANGSTLIGRKVLESDYAGELPTDTTNRCVAILGDFSEFVVAQRAGMVVETVRHLRDVSTGLPTGQRAFYVWARHGYDWTTQNAFVGLMNRTS